MPAAVAVSKKVFIVANTDSFKDKHVVLHWLIVGHLMKRNPVKITGVVAASGKVSQSASSYDVVPC